MNKKPQDKNMVDGCYVLADSLSQLVLREHQILQQEMKQVSSLVEDAVKSLDSDFKMLNDNVVEHACVLKKAVKNNLMDDSTHKTLSNIGQQMTLHTSRTVRALQFDDIVQQLTSHACERISQMQALFIELDKNLCKVKELGANDGEKVSDCISQMKDDINRFRISLEKENPVKQYSMQPGSIELF